MYYQHQLDLRKGNYPNSKQEKLDNYSDNYKPYIKQGVTLIIIYLSIYLLNKRGIVCERIVYVLRDFACVFTHGTFNLHIRHPSLENRKNWIIRYLPT